MNTYSQVLLANVPIVLPGGEVFQLIEAAAACDITFYGDNNRPISTARGVMSGLKVRPKEPFRNVSIVSATGQTIKAAIGDGDGEYNRTAGEVDSNAVIPAGFEGETDVALTNGAATLVAAANASRAEITITSILANTVEIRVGGQTTAAADKGTPLQPGESMTIETTAAIYVYCAAAAQKVALSFTEK